MERVSKRELGAARLYYSLYAQNRNKNDNDYARCA